MCFLLQLTFLASLAQDVPMCCSNFFIAIIRPRQLLEGSFAAYSSRGVSVCDHHGGEHGSRQMGVIQSYGGAVAYI